MIHQLAQTILSYIGDIGYFGIFLLMFLESTFFPFPSEIIMIPAGYLAFKGEMSIYIIILVGILGSLAGALFNYYFALKFGRKFIISYGKYFLVSPKTLDKLEEFFTKYGDISTFSGRLIPGIRQLISLPAGLAKMDMKKFLLYSGLGSGIWVIFLSVLGFVVGENQDLISKYLKEATIIALISISIITLIYFIKRKK
jgi:membrane protein DedA with SNARE-associated domain